MTPISSFKELLLRLLPDKRIKNHSAPYPNQQALAVALHVEASTISRILHSNDVLDIEGCLRLAKIGRYSYGVVFDLARKHHIAALIEHVAAGGSDVTVEERELLAAWRHMPSEARAALKNGFRHYTTEPAQRARRRRRRRS